MPGRRTFPAMTQAEVGSLKGWGGRGGMHYDPAGAAAAVFAGVQGDFRAEQVMYLFRRFGYPIRGWDGDKDVVRYYLTTPDPHVVLVCTPKSDLRWSFGFMLSADLSQEAELVERAWYRARVPERIEDHPVYQRIDQAIRAAMTELLRPVFIRDQDYHLLGPINAGEPYTRWKAAQTSHQAGYGLGGFDPSKDSR